MSNLFVIQGEASESDNEEENIVLSVCHQQTETRKVKSKGSMSSPINSGVIVAGEASESDNESDDACRQAFIERSGAVQNSDSDEETIPSTCYDTLLHKKLRDCNSSLYNNVCKQSRQSLINTVKVLNSTNQQLLTSQVQIQDTATSLNKAFNHLSKLSDSLNALLAIPYIPEINLP